MKFNKTILPTGKAFLSQCGEYKAVNYGGNIFLFKKIDCVHMRGEKKGKKYRAFGDSVEHTAIGASKKYKSYREAFKVAEIYSKNNQ